MSTADGGTAGVEMRASLRDFIPVTFSPLIPELNETRPSFLCAVFVYHNGSHPSLTYLQLDLDVNSSSLLRLASIAASNNDPCLIVRVFPQPLYQQLVDALIAQKDVEKLRTGLGALLPAGPEGAGWKDTTRWRLGEMKQKVLPGLIASLPQTPPANWPCTHYAAQLFVYNLPDYVRADDTVGGDSDGSSPLPSRSFKEVSVGVGGQGEEGPGSTPQILPTDTHDDTVRALGPGRYIIPQSNKTLLHFVKPVYPVSVSSPDIPPASSAFVPSSFIAIFACYSGEAPILSYLELSGNTAAIDRLRAIAEHNDDDEFTVKVFTQPLSQARVSELMTEQEPEELRESLAAAFPSGPEGDGWGDRDMWTVEEIEQRLLPGSVGLLPGDAPAGFYEYFCNYATQIFSTHLQDFVKQH